MAKNGEYKIDKEQSDEVLMREGNISLILDSYDDIFSDFDPRPYAQKTLSDDFLLECKKAASDKEKEIELRLLAPKHRRKPEDEKEIRKRLKNHFQKHYLEKQQEQKKMRMWGIMASLLGALLILIATLLYEHKGFLFNLLVVLFEPAGWFTIWVGMEKIFIDPKEKVPDIKFYKKMARAKIGFYSY
jgi:hypothetical protein